MIFKDSGPNSSTMTYSTDHYYDFNATLRLREMDTRGAVGYVAQMKGISEEKASQYIRDTIESVEREKKLNRSPKLDSTVVAYLSGDSTISLSDLTPDQINTLYTYLEDLGSSDNYKHYLENTYEYSQS